MDCHQSVLHYEGSQDNGIAIGKSPGRGGRRWPTWPRQEDFWRQWAEQQQMHYILPLSQTYKKFQVAV